MSTVAENRPGLFEVPRPIAIPAAGGVPQALGALATPQLHGLRAVALEPTGVAPGLMLWLEHAIAWELDRRAGRSYALHAPTEAIDPEQVSGSILALAALARRFGSEHPDVGRLFSAISASLDLGHVLH